MTHHFHVRVYYEDTDLAGIVYYANYLKFIERARSEWVRDLGIDQNAMKAEDVVFAVRRVEADYLQPAKFDDQLDIETSVHMVKPARLVVRQQVKRHGQTLFDALVTIICMTQAGRPTRLPKVLQDLA